ncbi:DNA adenine methylase [Motilibacter aurantiacus]|uniref:DNA adenine methylase n=1 Tax=Motilibacter aurantiacus TaxID=2714955 RepID=UPI00140900AD|nr:DNA adenine methylase [Motilibacter aurantiacus]NHC46135.1 DNA adenine methylase [Motilibacter aurantiacus]
MAGTEDPGAPVRPLRAQLLKWVGNKQRFAHEIAAQLPALGDGTYFEPFLGSGAVLATLAPPRAVASDAFGPLVGIWQALAADPEALKGWYADRWQRCTEAPDRVTAYEEIKAAYNAAPNPADLLFLSRSCYGGVVRFRKADGHMSTPCGVHRPIPPAAFAARVDLWRERTAGAAFEHLDYRAALALAGAGDVVYCDPPYTHTQAILYGAQAFRLEELFAEVAAAKRRGARVALSIDGSKKSGDVLCDVPVPPGLFEREVLVNVGRSMLRRFQMPGQDLRGEGVVDRLLLTY